MNQAAKSECGASVTAEGPVVPLSAACSSPSLRNIVSLARSFASTPAAPLVTALFVCLSFLTIPRYTLIPDVESAWSAVLGYANQKGLQFGTDIVFPYGPLGYLLVPHFLPQTDGYRLVFDFLLCFGVSAGVCLVAWRSAIRWRVLTIGVFVLVAANKPYGAQDLLLDLGVLSWGLLCLRESGRRRAVCTTVLVLLCGFATVAKITYLFSASLTIGAVAAVLFLDGRKRSALATGVGFVGAVVSFWELAGQQLVHLPLFISRAIPLCSGYDQAMTIEPRTPVLLGAIACVLGAAALVILRCAKDPQHAKGPQRWRQRLTMAWLLGLLFLSWKHGFVRADLHHTYLFLGFVSVYALALQALPTSKALAPAWIYSLTVLNFLASIGTLQATLAPKSLHLENCYSRILSNARGLLHPDAFHRELENSLTRERPTFALPRSRQLVGAESVDVFGNYQTFALLNGLNYRPRPVFQSYSAYNARLCRMNQDFYFSKEAPAYVLTTIEPIDERFPPLEDGPLLGDLLINYHLCGIEGGFLLLKHTSHEKPKLTLLSNETVALGQQIDLRHYGQTNLWLEVGVQPSPLGRALQFLYHLPPLHLRVWPAGTAQGAQDYSAPAPMLSSGFMASPLLASDADFLALYSGKAVTRPRVYCVESGGHDLYWQPGLRVRVFAVIPYH